MAGSPQRNVVTVDTVNGNRTAPPTENRADPVRTIQVTGTGARGGDGPLTLGQLTCSGG